MDRTMNKSYKQNHDLVSFLSSGKKRKQGKEKKTGKEERLESAHNVCFHDNGGDLFF